MSNGKYQVIKPPLGFDEGIESIDLYLGKSEKGVYCALYGEPSYFRIYILDDLSGKMEWIFKHSCSIQPCQGIDGPGPWTLQDINYHERCNDYEHGNNEAILEEKFEWDSDNDNVVDTKIRGKYRPNGYITFLGFHPFKEVVFLCDTLRRGLAYHLNSSKIQDLGNLHPTECEEMDVHPFIEKSLFLTHPGWEGFRKTINSVLRLMYIDILCIANKALVCLSRSRTSEVSVLPTRH